MQLDTAATVSILPKTLYDQQFNQWPLWCTKVLPRRPRADSGGKGKTKRAEKNGAKKSKEWREEPLGTMSYQTSSKRSPPFWLLIGARKLLCFSAQSEASRPMGRFVYPYTE